MSTETMENVKPLSGDEAGIAGLTVSTVARIGPWLYLGERDLGESSYEVSCERCGETPLRYIHDIQLDNPEDVRHGQEFAAGSSCGPAILNVSQEFWDALVGGVSDTRRIRKLAGQLEAYNERHKCLDRWWEPYLAGDLTPEQRREFTEQYADFKKQKTKPLTVAERVSMLALVMPESKFVRALLTRTVTSKMRLARDKMLSEYESKITRKAFETGLRVEVEAFEGPKTLEEKLTAGPPLVGCVYLVEDEDGRVKIGQSSRSTPHARIASLQTAHARPLKLLGFFTTSDPRASEKRLHETFHVYRLSGEWFQAPRDLINVVLDPVWRKAQGIY